jgi:hypothetical protein
MSDSYPTDVWIAPSNFNELCGYCGLPIEPGEHVVEWRLYEPWHEECAASKLDDLMELDAADRQHQDQKEAT